MHNILNFIKNNFVILLKIFAMPIGVFIVGNILLGFMRIDEVITDFDKPVHFISGASLALSLIILIKNLERNHLVEIRKASTNVGVIFMTILMVVVAWELFEFSLDTIFGTNFQDNTMDTKTDMMIGIIGGIFPLMFYWLVKIKVVFNQPT